MGERSAVVFKTLVAIGGGCTSYLFGGWSALLTALVALVILDVMLGVLASAVEGRLSSAKSFIGIARKVAIFTLVAVMHILDGVFNTGTVLRDAAICFYMAGEVMSITENAGRLDLPVPPMMKEALEMLNNRGKGKQ